MDAATQRSCNKIKEMETNLHSWASRLKADLEEKSQGGVSSGGGGRLTHPKDTTVEKLKDGCTKAEFMHWRNCLELHLETFTNWNHAGKILRKVRLSQEVADHHQLLKYMSDINHEEGTQLFSNYLDFDKMSRELIHTSCRGST